MIMGTKKRLPEIRSTRGQIPKEALRCRVSSTTAKAPSSEPEIPHSASRAPLCLPELSRSSHFSDFESDRFNINRYGISHTETMLSLHSLLQSTSSKSRLSLLPAMRLSQIDLYGLNTYQAELPRRQLRYETLPETLMDGTSQHTNISTTKYEPSLLSKSSTLRIRRSTGFASSKSQSTLATGTSLPIISSLRKSAASDNLRRDSSGASRSAHQINSETFQTPALANSSSSSSKGNASIDSVKHFESFCVLDTFVSGCPVTATSEDLRYIFQIGDQFILNIQECKGMSIEIVAAFSPDGQEVIHLLLFSPLLSPSTGTSRFLLAALVDVTHFLHEASQLPDLDVISEGSSSDDEIITPHNKPPQSSRSTRSYELLPEGLLGGCSVTAKPQNSPTDRDSAPSRRHKSNPKVIEWESEENWLDLSREERLEKDWQLWAKSSTGESLGYNRRHSFRTGNTRVSKSRTAVDEVLEDFMSTLQQLYSESFILARSPLDDKYYEICNVSPTVYASGEYLTGHLIHTAPNVIERMSERLGAGTPFRITVRWGSHGIEKRLYCIPLYGQSSITWICVLVDLHMPDLW